MQPISVTSSKKFKKEQVKSIRGNETVLLFEAVRLFSVKTIGY
jgi:hypothetical protein